MWPKTTVFYKRQKWERKRIRLYLMWPLISSTQVLLPLSPATPWPRVRDLTGHDKEPGNNSVIWQVGITWFEEYPFLLSILTLKFFSISFIRKHLHSLSLYNLQRQTTKIQYLWLNFNEGMQQNINPELHKPEQHLKKNFSRQHNKAQLITNTNFHV